MDPTIWSQLPYDLLESIANHCDIDSRRALGFKPRKLPKMDLPPFRPTWRIMPPVEVSKYLTKTKTLVYLAIWRYDEYFWNVKTDMNYDPDTDRWTFGPESTYHSVFENQETDTNIFYVGSSFQLLNNPDFV
jgi:hypothetical protein